MKLSKEETLFAKRIGQFHDNLVRPASILLRKVENRDRAIDENGNYKFVASLGEEIAVNLTKIQKYLNTNDVSFVDIGCGLGNVVALAKCLGYNSRGIELNEFYSQIGNPYNNISCSNIFDLNSIPDKVIFVYRPLHDMDKLFKHLETICAKNTIIYSFGVIPEIGEQILDNPFIIQL